MYVYVYGNMDNRNRKMHILRVCGIESVTCHL